LFITGNEGVMEVELDRDRVSLSRHDGEDRLPLKISPGQWNYHCEGPIHAVVDLAQGRGSNLTSGAIGASTVSVIAALAASSKNGGNAVAVVHPATTPAASP